MQTVQGKLSRCDALLSDVAESVAGEENAVVGRDELSRLRRRHVKLSEKLSKLCERINLAVQLRDSYWIRRTSLETCLEDCHHKVACLGIDDADDGDRLAQLEASYCFLFLIDK